MEARYGRTLKGYRLHEPIGASARSSVYRADQSDVGREVALKVIHPDVAGQPEFIRRFEFDVQRIARLEHLHIVPLYDYWRDPTGAYLAMRWLRGGSLHQALEQGPLDLATAVRLVEQIAAALAAAHHGRILHQNLKPTNILLDEEGNAYLSDFAIGADPDRPPDDVPPGAAGYLSPEQARTLALTPGTDIYSLGVNLYAALTGRHPFPGLSNVAQLYRRLNEPLPAIESVSAAVNAVIQKATAKDPAQRYADAPGLAAALRAAARLDQDGAGILLEESLTNREEEILAYILDGRTNRQIADALFIELSTVKWHITALYRKMGVRSRRQAVVRARELELTVSDREIDGKQAASAGASGSGSARPVNPYKGLRPFSVADSRDFFGREAVVDRLLGRLGELDQLARFLAVLGPSGSGKSSLLSAGLVPAVRAGRLPGSERWFVVQMTPGARPLDALEVALTRVAAEQAANLHAHLHRNAAGLLRAADLILPGDGSELLLVIDQFEELFTLARDETGRDFCLALIHRAVTDPRSRVRIVIALRADFYHRPLSHPEFGELVRSRMETLLPLSAAELERTIVQPAAQVDVSYAPGLPARIIADLLYQPGALPLLQYALTELFEARDGRVLTREAYVEMGGAVGALAQRADEIYLAFNSAAQEATRQMFLRLVSLDDDPAQDGSTTATRRQVARVELLSLAADADLMDEVIDTFGAYRLLSLSHDAGSRQPTVELAHEALLGEWARLAGWLADSRADLHQYHRFHALAAEWDRSGRDPGYLLRGARLDRFDGWAAGTDLALTPGEAAFLAASIRARTTRQDEDEARRRRELETARRLAAAETRRATEQARANRRLRLLAVGLALALVLALGAAAFALVERNRAAGQARLALARELAAAAVGNLAADPELSIHLALHAVQTTRGVNGAVLPDAEEALHRAVQASRVLLTLPQSGGVAFSPDGAVLVTGGADGAVTVWDADTGEPVAELAGHATAVTGVAFSPDGRYLATASTDHHRVVWAFPAGRPVLTLPGPGDLPLASGLSRLAFSPDGALLLSTASSAAAELWDVATGRLLLRFQDNAGPTAAFSPDGRRLALMTAVWDISGAASGAEAAAPRLVAWPERLFDYADPYIEMRASSTEIESIFREPGSVSYSPDGRRLLTSVVSSVAVIRDAATGARILTLTGHANVINDVAFGPHGRRVATAAADGTARLWDAATGRPGLVLEGHRDELVHLAFSPDGRRLATASLDGTTRVWDITPDGRGEWPGTVSHEGAGAMAFSPQAPRLATLGPAGGASIRDLRTGAVVSLPPDGSAAFTYAATSRNGETLALADDAGAVHLFQAADGRRRQTVRLDRLVSALTFSQDDRWLIAGSEDGILSIVDLAAGEVSRQWQVQQGFVNGLVATGNGRRLAIAGADGRLVVADLEALLMSTPGAPAAPLPPAAILLSVAAHQDVITQLALSPDGTRFMTASWDGTARLWDAATGDPGLTLSGHAGWVWQAVFSPDGRTIATAGAAGDLLVWDAASGAQRLRLDSLPAGIIRLAFSPDGAFLAAAGADGVVRVYVMPVADLMALARDRLTRTMTDGECRRYLHLEQCPD